ncbi:MAG TPA: PDZ domain-containing protein, partial [Ornithinibacter sp.]|nr:PDZ domain-containing protein [Ornithinibacter sp.]
MSRPTPDVLSGGGDLGEVRPGGRRHPSTRAGLLPAALLTATFVAIAVAAALSFVGLPYVVMSPGPATNILGEVDGKPLLSIEGAPSYPTSGSLDFTTVSVDGGPGVRVNVYDLAQAWLNPSREILPEEQVFPPQQSEEDAKEEGAAEMAGSQSVATATALRALGKDVDERVVIAGVPEGSPSEGVFEPDDVLVTIDGDPATSSEAVRTAVQGHEPGDTF